MRRRTSDDRTTPRRDGGAPRARHPLATDAQTGRLLGARLTESPPREPVALALPRGGVPIAVEVAATLGAPLGPVVARKITAPGEPGLGIGAVAEEGVRLLASDPALERYRGPRTRAPAHGADGAHRR